MDYPLHKYRELLETTANSLSVFYAQLANKVDSDSDSYLILSSHKLDLVKQCSSNTHMSWFDMFFTSKTFFTVKLNVLLDLIIFTIRELTVIQLTRCYYMLTVICH